LGAAFVPNGAGDTGRVRDATHPRSDAADSASVETELRDDELKLPIQLRRELGSKRFEPQRALLGWPGLAHFDADRRAPHRSQRRAPGVGDRSRRAIEEQPESKRALRLVRNIALDDQRGA